MFTILPGLPFWRDLLTGRIKHFQNAFFRFIQTKMKIKIQEHNLKLSWEREFLRVTNHFQVCVYESMEIWPRFFIWHFSKRKLLYAFAQITHVTQSSSYELSNPSSHHIHLHFN